ncbi:MAG: hypothetical protein WAN50_00185 [Minisyncoccia bacterium]
MRSAPCAVVCRGDGASVSAIINPAQWPEGDSVAGFGDTLADALRSLADEIERECEVTGTDEETPENIAQKPAKVQRLGVG